MLLSLPSHVRSRIMNYLSAEESSVTVMGDGVRTSTSPGGLRELSYTCTQLLQECNIRYGTGLPGLENRTWIPHQWQFGPQFEAQIARTMRNFTTRVHGDAERNFAEQIRRTLTNFSTLLHDEEEDANEDENEEQNEEEAEEQRAGLRATRDETGVHDDGIHTPHTSTSPRSKTQPPTRRRQPQEQQHQHQQQHPKTKWPKQKTEKEEEPETTDPTAYSSNPGSYDMC